MFLFLVRQPFSLVLKAPASCELISNYVLIFGSTTLLLWNPSITSLWIDFKLCSYFWFDNFRCWRWKGRWVVNWFQIMFLFLVRQHLCRCFYHLYSCELISNYVLIFGSTTTVYLFDANGLLWIDFKLCSYFWFDNDFDERVQGIKVVNWFQIMFLFLVRQLLPPTQPAFTGCELISNYVLIFGSTTETICNWLRLLLWIDFKLCSYFWFDN